MTMVFRSAPGQRAAVLSDSMSRWRVIDPVMAVIPSVLIRWDCDPLRGRASRGFAGADEVGGGPSGLPGCRGGTRLGPGFVFAAGCFGFTGRRARGRGWLGGQE